MFNNKKRKNDNYPLQTQSYNRNQRHTNIFNARNLEPNKKNEDNKLQRNLKNKAGKNTRIRNFDVRKTTHADRWGTQLK